MHPTTFIYSAHNCSPYIHRDIIVQRALEEHEDKRLLYLPMSENVRDGDEMESQNFGWGKFSWFLNRFTQWGLEPQPFFWSQGLSREDVDVLFELLVNAPVVILGGGNTFLGMQRYQALGEHFYGDKHIFCRLLHDRQARGQMTVGFSAGAEQLASVFSSVLDVSDRSCEGFGLARDITVTLHHEWGREHQLVHGAQSVTHCMWFGLPNDSGLGINTGVLPSGLIWQLIRFVVDTSWDLPNDQWHIKTRQGMKIDHFYADGRHWAFSEGDQMLRIMSGDGSFRRAWIGTGGHVVDYWTQEPAGYSDFGAILHDHA
ncbi:MAG: hypothetical protein HYY25_04070 [Candidatus Wallbacteria bacterium]|nr:hypothetical protein [Candidatus Wallbacteria bacterium]